MTEKRKISSSIAEYISLALHTIYYIKCIRGRDGDDSIGSVRFRTDTIEKIESNPKTRVTSVQIQVSRFGTDVWNDWNVEPFPSLIIESGLFSPYESEIHQNVRVEVRKTEVGPWFTLFPYDFTAPLSQPQAPSAFTRLMDFRIDFQNKREDIRVILLYNHIIQLFQRCVGWLGVTMESDLLNGLYGI
ncbi:unnamed protein product [Rhizophagus irregularis]|nr:unnamed protein product [Rhizophagus irregularis]